MKLPDLAHERQLWQKGFTVIGLDEVGRGAFAGPLFVGGVIFKNETNPERIKYLQNLGINDSKKVPENRRKLISEIVQSESLASQIGSVSVAAINRYGVQKANFMAMREVVKNLLKKVKSPKVFVLVDGFYIKNLKAIGLKNQKGIVHGDAISLTIAAASIIAKVARDEHMENLSANFPNYGWERNKGYGTLFHRNALKKHGTTIHHRTDFVEGFI